MAKSIKELKEKMRQAALEADAAKKAKYRVKNAEGKYETIHLETSADQVITSAEKQFVSAAEKTSYLDKYTQAQIDAKITEVNKSISTLEENDATHLSKITALEEADKSIRAEIGAVDAKVDSTKQELTELINSGGSALDEYKVANDAKVKALETGKAEKIHNHEVANITGLREELDKLETKENVSTAITAAKDEVKSYTDSEVGKAKEAVEAAKAELDGKKINKTDISNELNVTEEGKVLDARQGKILKELIDQKAGSSELQSGLAGKAEKVHTHAHTEITGLGSAATKEVGNLEGQLVAVGTGNKIDAALLPSIAINETFVVDSEDEAMQQTVEAGDIVIINVAVEELKNANEMFANSIASGVNTFIVVKADAETFDEKFRPLMSTSDGITKGEVTEALAKKLDVSVYSADKSQLEASIGTKANAADVYNKTEVDSKVDEAKNEVTRVENKFDSAVQGINEAVAKKVDTETLTEKLATKAETEVVNKELAKKANQADVTSALEAKAEKEYVDQTMATKEALTSGLAEKADKNTVNTELAKKANQEEVTTALSQKAEKSTVYTKAEVESKIKENAPSITEEEPVGKSEGHIWLELVK